MLNTLINMVRRRKSFNLDEEVIDALPKMADKNNMSVSRYVEETLLFHMKQAGVLPSDKKPLGETRGGDFKSNKYKKENIEND